jgi:hypothetical protein
MNEKNTAFQFRTNCLQNVVGDQLHAYNCTIMHISVWFFSSEDFPHDNAKGKYINLYPWQQYESVRLI